MNSRSKGKRGELELAAILREHGFDARRGVQYSGGADSPDVVGLPGWHVECKRTERFDLYGALEQAVGDITRAAHFTGLIRPVVIHKRNRMPWVAVMPLEDFLALVKK